VTSGGDAFVSTALVVTSTHAGEVVVCVATGELDLATVGQLRDAVLSAAGGPQLRLDLSGMREQERGISSPRWTCSSIRRMQRYPGCCAVRSVMRLFMSAGRSARAGAAGTGAARRGECQTTTDSGRALSRRSTRVSASTTRGWNWVPAQRRSSASASSGERAAR
jgi:hypothetical protein